MADFDRGAFESLHFHKCKRGFTLTAQRAPGEFGTVFAFDNIEGLADWLVGQYRVTHPATNLSPEEQFNRVSKYL